MYNFTDLERYENMTINSGYRKVVVFTIHITSNDMKLQTAKNR
jgi:hypothetical protein